MAHYSTWISYGGTAKITLAVVLLILVVFAVWGLSGFGYPSAPLPYALNVLSKILAFVTALSLFWPQRATASAPRPVPGPEYAVAVRPYTCGGLPRHSRG
jgi:hypothetical protein